MTSIPRNVAVIGAGIVGVSTALWLAREGQQVTLVDRAGPGEATSFGNAGLLASAATLPVPGPGLLRKAPRMALDPREPLYLRMRHLPALAPWLFRYLRHASAEAARKRADAILPLIGDSLADHQALASGTPAEKYVLPCDYVYGYADRSGFEADRFSWDLRTAQGFDFSVMDRTAFRSYDPIFGDAIGCAVRMPNHGRISDPGAYVKALAAAAEGLGAKFVRSEAKGIVRKDGQVRGLRLDGDTLPCDTVVVAAGAWSKELTRSLGLVVPLHPESGFHIELWDPSQTPRAPLMFAAGKFVITPMEGRIRLAGMVGYGGFDAPPPEAPYRMFLRHLKKALPGLEWKETTRWMGHRPAMADSLPMIGPVPGISGVYTGFGHDHVGLTAGPKTGRILAQMISGRRPNIDVGPFAPERFSC
ncbi:NAD(P)/FAD-dependent oxidoreductase [Roseovarius sp. B08]|uniref:NAD(P)/FAD-dependent oxidoreductase n=1 Tax=Roseovarius sp. B08 TaxID=3449223 RepID=UPI003EDBC53B